MPGTAEDATGTRISPQTSGDSRCQLGDGTGKTLIRWLQYQWESMNGVKSQLYTKSGLPENLDNLDARHHTWWRISCSFLTSFIPANGNKWKRYRLYEHIPKTTTAIRALSSRVSGAVKMEHQQLGLTLQRTILGQCESQESWKEQFRQVSAMAVLLVYI